MIQITLTAGHTSGVVAGYGGRTYFRAPLAPTGRVLFLDVETCEPLLVPVDDGFHLPTFEIFTALLRTGMISLEFEGAGHPHRNDAAWAGGLLHPDDLVLRPRHEPEVTRGVLRRRSGPPPSANDIGRPPRRI